MSKLNNKLRKYPTIGVLVKSCFKIMQQIYRRTPMLSNFIEITLQHGCSPVNMLHIFRTAFYKNTYERLLVNFTIKLTPS